MVFVKNLKQISKKDVLIAGGKGASLGGMLKFKIPVPQGFVILTNSFEKFLEQTNIDDEINMIRKKINIKDIKSVEQNSKIIKSLIVKTEIPKEIESEILKAFQEIKLVNQNLKTKNNFFVAVRSSATSEDSKMDSWAGQLESYLNIVEENLIENIKKCWASLFTPRALFYRIEKKLECKKVSVAVVIQEMIDSEISGVCFTAHPVIKDKNQMVIEAVYGLGEALVQGEITPDIYIVEKLKKQNSKLKFNILNINVVKQKYMIVKDEIGIKKELILASEQIKQKLSKEQIKKLAEICLNIEKYYKSPQDIEWVFRKNKFYIIQSRPITTL